MSFRLYRRVVEIRDGWLALRPYFEPQVSAFARQLCHDAGLAGNDADAVIEAASLVAALSAKASGIMPGGVSDQSVPFVGGADLAAEIAKLERVSHNFEHSPIVRSVRARIEQRARTAEGQIVVAEDS